MVSSSLQYPYYTHTNKAMMYSVGSLFYAIYFFVSFPAFFLMDEDASAPRMPLWRAGWDGLAAGMLVLIILDFWRLYIGSIAPSSARGQPPPEGLPWLGAGLS
jgi:cycloeucalenol cycloisomerase